MLRVLKKRKFRLLLACISLLLLINTIQETYAKYVSSASATSNLSIARWAFSVNSQDIIANNNFSSTLTPTFDADSNISSGVIAPTSTGHFEILIDSSQVGVAFDQTITVYQGQVNTVTDLVLTGYKINDGTMVSLSNVATTTLTTEHLLNEENTTNKYTFYFKWNDDASTESMNNAADTNASANGNAIFDISINFIQKASQP